MKRGLAGVLTAAVLGLLLLAGLRRPDAGPGPGPGAVPATGSSEGGPTTGPEACLRTLFEAGRRGDLAAYLDGFAGPLRARLDREAEERGRAAFADDLRRAAGARKSHAVFAPEPDGPDAARIVVEAVYPDRNERQTYRLERLDAAWRVTAVETVRSRSPREKYGSPATYEAPEGVPVQPEGLSILGDDAPAPPGGGRRAPTDR